MTPKLQQAIKVMQMTTMELELHVLQELQMNPFLEEGLDLDLEDEIDGELREIDSDDLETKEVTETEPEIRIEDFMDDSMPSFQEMYEAPEDDEDNDRRAEFAQELSFQDYLEEQLSMYRLPPDDREVCLIIIGNLDDDGFLEIGVEEIVELTGRDPDEVEEILRYVQTHFDPIGIGARDRREYFLLQIDAPDPIASAMVRDHYDDFLKNQLSRVAKQLRDDGYKDATPERLQDAKEWLTKLQLSPAQGFLEGYHGVFKFKSDSRQVTPDVIVDFVDDDYRIRAVDESVPRVHLNRHYLQLLKNKERLSPEEKKWLDEYRQRALELIESIQERGKTIENVAKEIFDVQRDFLDQGVKHLKPLVLRDIAERLGKHESTISRATNGKYVQTPRGTFELKYFFSSGLDSDDGDTASSTSVKAIIREIIQGEDPAKPLSDQALSNVLKDRGINAARRTVAKYREELGIAPSSQRKNSW